MPLLSPQLLFSSFSKSIYRTDGKIVKTTYLLSCSKNRLDCISDICVQLNYIKGFLVFLHPWFCWFYFKLINQLIDPLIIFATLLWHSFHSTCYYILNNHNHNLIINNYKYNIWLSPFRCTLHTSILSIPNKLINVYSFMLFELFL